MTQLTAHKITVRFYRAGNWEIPAKLVQYDLLKHHDRVDCARNINAWLAIGAGFRVETIVDELVRA